MEHINAHDGKALKGPLFIDQQRKLYPTEECGQTFTLTKALKVSDSHKIHAVLITRENCIHLKSVGNLVSNKVFQK